MLHSRPSRLVPDAMLPRPAMSVAHHQPPSDKENEENAENPCLREPLKQPPASTEALASAASSLLGQPAKENEPPHQGDNNNNNNKPHQIESSNKHPESDKHRTRRDTVV